MTCLVGIDIGTSACKVAVFTPEGRVIAQASRDYAVYYPAPGWAEQDPADWWRAACEALREALADIHPAQVAGVGIDGQSWAAVALDGAGEVLCNTPIWMDTRAADCCRDALDSISAERLFAVCGNPLQPTYTLPKVLWYRAHRPALFARISKILQCNGYIAYRLTGSMTQDVSQGYGWHCFDMRRATWDAEVLRALALSPALLPEIVPCHQVIGRVTARAAAQSGLTEGTPVVAGGLDAACGTLGAGVHLPGQTQEQGGQAGGMSICMQEPVADPRLILSQHVVPGRWLLQGGTVGGGGALRWLSEQLFSPQERAARGGEVFAALSALATDVPPGSDGLVFLPYMAGERSPIWDARAKGVYYGLDYAKTRGHLARACMEGVAYALRHNLEVAAQAGAQVGAMHAMGGSANSRVWTQIKADATGHALHVPASDTATTLGAALLAGVGTGVYVDFTEAVRRTVRITRTHTPDPSARPAYDAGYAAYRGLYEQLHSMMDDTNGKL